MRLPFLIAIFILVLRTVILVSNENKVEMIVDYLQSQKRPTAVNVLSCWKSKTKVNMIARLGNLSKPTAIKFIQWNQTNHLKNNNIVIIVDLSCPQADNFFQEAEEKKMLDDPYRWLILTTEESEYIPNQLRLRNVLPNSEVFIARRSKHDYFSLYLIYKVHKDGNWITETYGNWTSEFGIQKSALMDAHAPARREKTPPEINKIFAQCVRRKNLAKHKIATAFNVNDADVGFDLRNCDDWIRSSRHSVTRWGFEQMLVIYDYLNATRVNVITDNWGYFVNGSWNGVIGNMARGEVDLAGTALFLTRGRMKFAEYLIDPVLTSVKFVFREPPLSYQNNLFLLPFTKAVWAALAGFVLILMLVIYINALWESQKSEIVKDDIGTVPASNNKLSLSDVALIIVGAIAQQGNSVQLKGSIGRVVTFNLFLACLFLFTAYSANIVALLQSSSKQIRTLSDLLNSRLELGAEDTAYNIHYFTTATEPVRKAIYETKIAPRGLKPKFMSLEEGVRKLQKHPFAFNMDVGVGYRLVEEYFYEHEKCGLQEIAYVPPYKPWLTCRRGSPYTEIFKIGLYRMREHGMGARANGLVYSKKPLCTVSGASFDSVSIVDAYPPLLLLLYGMLLAVALLIAEILVHRYMKKKRHRNEVNDIWEAETISSHTLL